MKILTVVGVRPDFVKIAPLAHEFDKRGVEHVLVHTGQQYDARMHQIFFDELELPKSDIDLGVGSGSHAVQTAEVMIHFDEVIHDIRPDAVLIVGQVNATLACALGAAKLFYPVIRMDAGLRVFDRRDPEEVNRVIIDHLSSLLFTSAETAERNLKREGIPDDYLVRVGNIVVDTLRTCRERAIGSDILNRLAFTPHGYVVATVHHPFNLDNPDRLNRVVSILEHVASRLPVILPIHPVTRERAATYMLLQRLASIPNLHLADPMGYMDFVALVSQSKFVLTDSGGLQEESTVLGVPCLTLLDRTEREATVLYGTNRLVGLEFKRIEAEIAHIFDGTGKRGGLPEMWDGHTATRMTDAIERFFKQRAAHA